MSNKLYGKNVLNHNSPSNDDYMWIENNTWLLGDVEFLFECSTRYRDMLSKITFRLTIDGLQPISRDTDNNAAMYNCWWTNKRS